MPDIFHDFPIRATPAVVFDAVSTSDGLDRWWTKQSSGAPVCAAWYALAFGPDHNWSARVTQCEPLQIFELEMMVADPDWLGTRVGFQLQPNGGSTQLRFHHTGWPSHNEHFRISCYCWAMYLRVLKRNLEYGERVPYEARLEV